MSSKYYLFVTSAPKNTQWFRVDLPVEVVVEIRALIILSSSRLDAAVGLLLDWGDPGGALDAEKRGISKP